MAITARCARRPFSAKSSCNTGKRLNSGSPRPSSASYHPRQAPRLEKPELAFGYRFTSGGHSHDPLIHDWEVQEAYRQYKRRYGDAAIDHLTRMYGETIPARNLHLVMGTMLAHPRTFIIIGLPRSGFDPQELAKQGSLF
jgi:hypothetical protein